ncbi:YIP1 family protein [Amaricoccus solimangrovi]|uniref:YIP1 family protein n=1 Tax=Amaricoccus solimangrovi TaxID=2589815 RepID=A0A501WYS8_9RHOB|nr:YIP1 family protein [Amaricoccus solimangrovi]TPE53820.1 YIP1 family protein [Amaricoccus solimangrovi]
MTAPASRGLVAAMAEAYRRPRAAMAGLIARGITEGGALALLFIACALGFVASVPEAARRARALDIEDPVAGAVAAHLFAYLFLAPLLAYALAALAHLVARGFGARGGFFRARVAVFWSVLLGAPLALAMAALRSVAEMAGGLSPALLPLAGLAAFLFWLRLLAASFAEAEGFSATWRVGAVLGLAFGLVAVSLSMLTRGMTPPG